MFGRVGFLLLNTRHGPAYGAQKAGVDKMAADMAVDFGGTNVATVSVWMGILLTERMRVAFAEKPAALATFAEHAECRPSRNSPGVAVT